MRLVEIRRGEGEACRNLRSVREFVELQGERGGVCRNFRGGEG